MSYNELRNALKIFKSQGLTTIALNAKKAILQAVNSEPEQSQDYSQDYADIYSRTASKNEDIALTELTRVDIDPIEDIAAAAKNLANEIAQDYADLCDRIACEIEDIEQSDSTKAYASCVESVANIIVMETVENIEQSESIKYPSISDYDPEQSVDYFGFLDEIEPSESVTVESLPLNGEKPLTQSRETINAIEVKETFKSISKEAEYQAREKIFDDLAKLLTIFVSSLIKVWLIQRRLFNRISQWVYQVTPQIEDTRAGFNAFAQWYFSGFAIPQFN